MPEVSGLRIFDDAVAIINGGASGIGEAFAVELTRRGAKVVIADLDDELASALAKRIRESGGEATHAQLDVSDHGAVKAVVEDTVARHGRLDFMFNMAGIIYIGTALDHTIEDWNRLLDVNIRGVVNGVDVAYPIMVEQGFGHIVNMSSTSGLVPFFNVPYTMSRYAIVGMSLTLRGEASMHGVRVTLLCPGAVRTLTFLESGKYGKNLRKVPDEVRQAAAEKLRPIDPARYVRGALRAIARNRAMHIAPWRARYISRSYRRTPLLTTHLMFKYGVKPMLLDGEQYELVSEQMETTDAPSEGSTT